MAPKKRQGLLFAIDFLRNLWDFIAFWFCMLGLMSETVIKVENLTKFYQLGLINHGTLAKDLQGWWAKFRGRDDPNSRISLTNSRNNDQNTDFIYALKDVSFDVQQGEVLGIIGANGAGKSTLLKILSRVTSPTSGCIKIKGRIGSLLEVGTGFHPELTGRENIYLNGAILGMRRHEIDKKLDEIIDFSGVEKFIDTPVKRYSSGMYVRLAFAVAAHLDPEILVVDEVLAVGDAEFQKKCLGKMGDVSKKEGRTILFVSHNMAAVRQLCTRGILLRNGSIYFQGSVEDTVDTYLKSSASICASYSIKDAPRLNKGNGDIKFVSADVVDSCGNIVQAKCGQPFCLRIGMQVKDGGCLSVSNSLAIYDLDGRQLITLPAYVTIGTYNLSSGLHYAYCYIKKLPLAVGEYRMGFWVGANGECYDHIDAVVPLSVAEDVYFTSGRTIASRLQGKVVLVEHSWKID